MLADKFSMIQYPAAVFCEIIAYSTLDYKQYQYTTNIAHICI